MHSRNLIAAAVAISVASLFPSCQNTPPVVPNEVYAEQRSSAKDAVKGAVDQMLEELRELNSGRYPELRVAFIAEVESPPYTAMSTPSIDFGNSVVGGSEIVTGTFKIPPYFQRVRRDVERLIENETNNALLVYDYELFGVLLRKIGVADHPLDVILPETRDKLRTASEEPGSEPIDAICRIKVTGVQLHQDRKQASVDSTQVEWDVEIRMVDATARATSAAKGYAQIVAQEEVLLDEAPAPLIDIGLGNGGAALGSGSEPVRASFPIPTPGSILDELGEEISGAIPDLNLPNLPLDIEPNDTADAAQALAPGSAASGLIGGAQDIYDYYVVDVPTAGQLSARLTNANATGSKGAVGSVRIESATGQRLTSTAGTVRKGGGQKATAPIPLQAGTRVYVRVSGADKNLPIPYQVEVLFE